MSRIGNKPIQIPAGVTVTCGNDHIVSVKGPKGELKQVIDRDMLIDINGDILAVKRPTEQKRHKAMHGLYRAIINNMITGVTKGYVKELELVGVGYKVEVLNKDVLDLSLGFSHHVYFKLPPEIKVNTVLEKGQNPKIVIEGFDKQLVGQVAAKIKSLRPVEPYKGKGIRYLGEKVRRKAGKAGK
ncbi:MAG TPA: 50S ribosomal protein L6, partial [Cyclobacteriaceae bacterium]|nr:50S ribosomal protein L6 [Cyclobacteriaceae bacterium]